MLKPSYSELMDILNEQNTEQNQITSRYMIVIAASKRARQIIDGARLAIETDSDKPMSIAVNELNSGKVKVTVQN